MKTCKECNMEKTLDEFYTYRQGQSLFSSCKECVKTNVSANRRERFEQYSAYERRRYKENIERRKNLQIKAADWRKQNPEAYKAQTAVSNAVRDGRLFKEPCMFCGTTENIHAHHNSYSRPLDVVWLCAKCHHRMHAHFPMIEGHGDHKNA